MSYSGDDSKHIQDLLAAARHAHDPLRNSLLARARLVAVSYGVTSRVKSFDRALQKLYRLRETSPSFDASRIEDLLGFRITALFQSNLADIIEVFAEIIKSEADIDSIIVNRPIDSVRVLTSRAEQDPLSPLGHLRDVLSRHNIQPVVQPTTDGYSSVHLTLRCRTKRDSSAGPIMMEMPVEFQIRTMMEDAWGQISHYLYYGRSGTRNEKVQMHLTAMKQMIDAVLQYAEIVKTEADSGISAFEFNRETPRSAASLQDAVHRLPDDVPEDLTKPITKALQLRSSAQNDDEMIAPKRFEDAAAAFNSLEKAVETRSDIKAECVTDLIYMLQMEQAFCLIYTNDEKNIEFAIEIYDRIKKANETDVLCAFRMGIALRRHKNLNGALDCLNKAAELLSKDADLRVPADHWVRSAVYREMGLINWLQFQETLPAGGKIDGKLAESLNLAVRHARLGLEVADRIGSEDERIQNINNLLYYAWEQINAQITCAVSPDEMMTLFHEIGRPDVIQKFSPRDRDSVVDTACRLATHFKMRTEAQDFAKQVIDLLLNKFNKRKKSEHSEIPIDALKDDTFTSDEKDTYYFALRVLASPA